MEEVEPKEAFNKLKPEWVVFVISVDENQKPNGMVAARFMKCARHPPLIAVSVGKGNNTHRLIRASKEFVVAVANQDLLEYIDVFGGESGRDSDKFEKTGIETLPSRHISTPLLKEASVNIECRLENELSAGDGSTVFFGRVLATHINKGKKILYNYGSGHGEYIFKEL